MPIKKEPIDLSQPEEAGSEKEEKNELSFSRSLEDSKVVKYIIQNTGKTIDTPKKALFVVVGVSFLLIGLSLFFVIARPALTTLGENNDSSRPGIKLEYGR